MACSATARGLALAAVCALARGFYLPGVAPRNFQSGEKVELTVNKMSSTKTQLPYEYYSLPFCKPETLVEEGENLGEVLSGDSLVNSAYSLHMAKDSYCNLLCRKVYTDEEAKLFADRIEEDYRVDWIIDNIPAAMRLVNDHDPSDIRYDRGYPLGQQFPSNDGTTTVHYLHNHVRMVIKVHQEPEQYEGYRIVGFEVEPHSVKHSYSGKWDDEKPAKLTTCSSEHPVDMSAEKQSVDGAGEVIFTYDVKWEQSDIKWSQRWDLYLKGNPDDQIHWFSIINSLMIVLFLTGMVAMILIRALRRDIARYNDESVEEAQEETGWKLVHGDVFRPPAMPLFLSVLVGSGAQVLSMALAVLIFAVLGFLSPANSGGLMTALLLLFVFMGSFAGYASARLFKMLGGKAWKRNTLLTSTLAPGIVFSIVFVLNFFVWGEKSSSAIPFFTFFALILLWFGVSTPLVFLGAYFGYKKDPLPVPVRVNRIPRQVPEQPLFMHPVITALVGGVLPFGAVFIELFFIMSALWLHHIYYVFGFLSLVILILIATCAEISIVLCYFQLCNEDYHWWWRSFLTAGSSALYLMLYSVLYFLTKLEIVRFTSALLYFGYMAIISFLFFLLTGTIGFVACLFFVRTIYGSIKVA